MLSFRRSILPASIALLLAASAAPAATTAPALGGWLGVTLNAAEGGPLSVEEVFEGGPADKAGVKAGDVLVSWNGAKVGNLDDLRAFLEKTSAGDQGMLGLRRGEKELTVRVKLGDREKAMKEIEARESEKPAETEEAAPEEVELKEVEMQEEPAHPQVEIQRAHVPGGAFLGVHLAENEGQVAIESTVEGSPAAKMGMVSGEIIRSIDGKAVESAQQVVEAIRSKKPGDRIEVKTMREGSEYSYMLHLGKAPAAVAEAIEPEHPGPSALAQPRIARRMPAVEVAPEGAHGTPHPEAQALHNEVAQLRAELARVHAEMAEMKALLQEIAARLKR